MIYTVELTRTAEKSYAELYTRAQACLGKGDKKHPAVLAFTDVEQAIDIILPYNPCVPERALAGTLSDIYCLPLRNLTVSYLVHETRSVVVVLTIVRKAADATTQTQLANAMESGELDGLMQELGIESPLGRLEVNSQFMH